MLYGIDYLGAGGPLRYIDRIEAHHPDGWAAGFLLKCSGWDSGIKAAHVLARTNRCYDVRFHGLWLDSHRFEQGHVGTMVRQAKRVAKFKELHPEINIAYSPALEPVCSEEYMINLRKACRKVLPREIPVVCGREVSTKRAFIEVHHSLHTYPKEIFSFDGEDCFEANVDLYRQVHSHAEAFYFWSYMFNCKRYLTDNLDRSQRRVVPRAKHFRRIVQLAREYDAKA